MSALRRTLQARRENDFMPRSAPTRSLASPRFQECSSPDVLEALPTETSWKRPSHSRYNSNSVSGHARPVTKASRTVEYRILGQLPSRFFGKTPAQRGDSGWTTTAAEGPLVMTPPEETVLTRCLTRRCGAGWARLDAIHINERSPGATADDANNGNDLAPAAAARERGGSVAPRGQTAFPPGTSPIHLEPRARPVGHPAALL